MEKPNTQASESQLFIQEFVTDRFTEALFSPKNLRGFKQELFLKYPDQKEAIEVISGIKDYLDLTLDVQYSRDSFTYRKLSFAEREELKNKIRSLTEFQFLFTKFILDSDRVLLLLFWKVFEKVSQLNNSPDVFKINRRGLLNQAAAFHILKAVGENPVLSKPREDAFNAIDFWIEDSSVAVQVTGEAIQEPEILGMDVEETESISFPVIETKQGNQEKVFTTDHNKKFSRFKTSIKKYGDFIGKNLRGYMLIIPKFGYDQVTGEPNEEVVEKAKEKLNTR